ncbi:MAG: hypothetical protein GOP50_10585 [Candidatus Heimdallarchaeota archaeon]|nr:hypothetical protein [Candidatus Heimdallarchaeota archaeon]
MKKIKLTFIFALGILITSVLISDVSNAILASDVLEVGATSYVEGELLLDTAAAADKLIAKVTITVTRLFTPTDITDKLIEFEVQIRPVDPYNFGFLANPTYIRLKFLVFNINRSTIMLTEYFVEDAFETIEMTVLHETTYEGMIKPDNRKITFANGTTALAGAIEHADPMYILLEQFSDLSKDFLFWHKFTIFAISPTAVVGDDISYDPNLGIVIGTPAVMACDDQAYDSIKVEYYETGLFNQWGDAYEVHAYYEAATGFLIKIEEFFDQGTWKFIPCTLNTVVAPFPTVSVIVGIAVIGLVAYYFRKKR